MLATARPMRRVVVTGIGAVTPLGSDIQVTWERLLEAESGARPIESFEVADLPARIACEVPTGNRRGAFNPDDWLAPKEQRKVDRFIVYGIAAAEQALRDAGWVAQTETDQIRTGVLLGSGHRRAAGDRECLDPGSRSAVRGG